MESILQFIYLGEARLYNERIGDIIKVAKDLEILKISDTKIDDKEKETTEEYVPQEMEDIIDGLKMGSGDWETIEDKSEVVVETFEKEPQIYGKETKPRKGLATFKASDTICPECGAVFSIKGAMMRHFRSKHEGIKYPCIAL